MALIPWMIISFFVGSTVHFHTACSSDILVVPMESEGSHYYVMKSIADELASRGHQVTMLLNGRHEDTLRRQANANLSIQMEFFKPNITLEEYDDFLTGMTNAGLRGEYISWIMETFNDEMIAKIVAECHNILYDADLMKRLKNSNFKVALVDFGVECPLLQLLKHDIGLPYISVSAVITLPALLTIANRMPYNPAYMPEIMTGYDHHLSFSDRLANTMLSLLFTGLSSMENHLQDTYAQFDIPDAWPHHADAELWLMNTHFAFDFPRPLLPNTKPVGGLTTRPAKPLPKVSSTQL